MTRPTASAQAPPVLALVTDGPDAPAIARRAAELAWPDGCVLLLVPVRPLAGWSTDAALVSAATR